MTREEDAIPPRREDPDEDERPDYARGADRPHEHRERPDYARGEDAEEPEARPDFARGIDEPDHPRAHPDFARGIDEPERAHRGDADLDPPVDEDVEHEE